MELGRSGSPGGTGRATIPLGVRFGGRLLGFRAAIRILLASVLLVILLVNLSFLLASPYPRHSDRRATQHGANNYGENPYNFPPSEIEPLIPEFTESPDREHSQVQTRR